MKIWILNHVALKPNETGITRHYDLSKYMVQKGHEVTIFASSFLAYLFKWRNPNKKNYRENVNGVVYEWVWTLPYKGNSAKRLLNMISYFFLALFRGMQLKEKPDVIVGSSVHLFACLAGYFLSKWKKASYVVEIRDLWPRTLIEFGSMSERHPVAVMFGIIEKFVYKKAEKIIVTLPGAHKYITTLGIPREKIVYIPNGIDMSKQEELENPSSMEAEIAEIRKKYPRIALYIGSHGMANSLYTIVESAEYLHRDDTAYVFIGEGPEKEGLKKAAKHRENIYFFSGVPKNEVLSTVNLADVVLVSMLNTNLYRFGISLNKLNDYLMVGNPILFAGKVYNNIVEAANAGITVPPEDPKAFADGLNQLLDLSAEQRQEIKANSFAYLYENHNMEKLAERFIAVCEEVQATKTERG
ncbi:glycosyltransferase family 4 protein [Bacillus sp. V5-8f]|uniref:glycosyltransferase family 4 protein n=1 Tax=Bacillus sp. V5-8f TaxID=2053044 RepID=UPI000C7736CE|nr:glycosyltransferase family 4 protein [Bacillus sp. V5-8f]PLT35724.1 glycosyltransferase WbuB [Bacillus sp. V5-8f]